jgi:hypothetical protein
VASACSTSAASASATHCHCQALSPWHSVAQPHSTGLLPPAGNISRFLFNRKREDERILKGPVARFKLPSQVGALSRTTGVRANFAARVSQGGSCSAYAWRMRREISHNFEPGDMYSTICRRQ